MDKAKKVIDLMVIKHHVRDIASCYKALVNGYMQAKRIDEALRLVEEMIEQGVMPDVETLKALRGLCPKRHDPNPKETIDLEKLMLGCIGLHPEVSTLSIVINFLCSMNLVDLGFSVLATTLKHGLEPNAYTLTALLHGVCKYRSISEAMQLFRKI
ncbi:pentatricopeptide repeat-containing protein [Prunus yedoensis var. nudiflora]|uniref:Pentatricopeptide repeat-containing protein n=1 Tax=Prunus yedoensis var. nudiflora TaxID=2094558 RepID=A0A314Y2Q1_PRUYE|nr:pentatricopeptide repeat-containing protein [Prunus yedoensis var. nudiflora]